MIYVLEKLEIPVSLERYIKRTKGEWIRASVLRE